MFSMFAQVKLGTSVKQLKKEVFLLRNEFQILITVSEKLKSGLKKYGIKIALLSVERH